MINMQLYRAFRKLLGYSASQERWRKEFESKLKILPIIVKTIPLRFEPNKDLWIEKQVENGGNAGTNYGYNNELRIALESNRLESRFERKPYDEESIRTLIELYPNKN